MYNFISHILKASYGW